MATHQPAAVVVVEPLEQLQRRRLSVSTRTDDGDELTRFHFEVEPAQNVEVGARRVVEPDVFVVDVRVAALLKQKYSSIPYTRMLITSLAPVVFHFGRSGR